MTSTYASVPRHLDLLTVALLALAPSVAAAQQMDPDMHMPMSMPMPLEKAAPAKKPPRNQTTRGKAGPAASPAPKHKPRPKRPAVSGSGTAPSTHGMPMDHSAMGHDTGAMPVGSMPMDRPDMQHAGLAPTQPRTPIPVLTQADRLAAQPPAHDHPVHDNSIQSYTLFDRLETWNADQGAALEWEGQAWIGTDLNRLWLRSEGERVDGRTESADLEVLYGRSVAAWWDVVAGVRHDFKPGASEDFAAIGVMGVAPYKFEVQATAYIGQSGQTAARLEGGYETLLTNRLILQPRVEINLYGKDDPGRGIGSGLSTVETGLRLRYEFTRRFAPYVGLVREQAFGSTADLRHQEGGPINDTRFVAGVRIWF